MQYWSEHRNEPPRCTRFFSWGSDGSNGVFGALRIVDRRPRARVDRVRVGAVPIADPFPDVPRDVVQAIAVRRELRDRCVAGEAVVSAVAYREASLVRVRHDTAVRVQLAAPRVELARKPPARRELELGLGRQAFAGPFGVGPRVVVGDLHHGEVFPPRGVASRALGMAPARPVLVAPPVVHVVERHRACGRREHGRAGDEVLLRCRRELLVRRRALGDRDVARRADELGVLRVRHLGRIHPEPVDAHAVDRLRVARDPGERAQRVAGSV